MGSMLAPNAITFSDEDLLEMRTGHNNALFITIKCRDIMVPKVLIDGESGVNIIPLEVAWNLNISEESLPSLSLVIRAFDSARRKVRREISLEIMVGPVAFDTTFQVLETAGSFNMLVGHPWIHQAGAVPSTVHQRVKSAHNGKLITVKDEYDIPICNEIELPYLKEPHGEPNTAQAVEIINMIRIEEDMASPLNFGAVNAARYMLKCGYQVGLGLGAHQQGDFRPVHILIKCQNDKRGLGYIGIQEHDYMRSLSFCHVAGFPHISESFVPSSQSNLEQEQLMDELEGLNSNMIEEAPNSSEPNATLEG